MRDSFLVIFDKHGITGFCKVPIQGPSIEGEHVLRVELEVDNALITEQRTSIVRLRLDAEGDARLGVPEWE